MSKKIVKHYANVIFHWRFLTIGGCEQYVFEFIYKYSKLGYEIDLFYIESLSEKQIDRIVELIGKDHVHKYNGEIVYCDRLFINYDMYGFIENVYAEKVYNIIHANFEYQQNFALHDSPKITNRLGVSNIVSKAFKRRFKIDTTTCYNPITIKPEDNERVLNLISATRLTEEKGKDRMKQLMLELDKRKIKYYWHIYTNDKDYIRNPNVIYHDPTLDIRPYIANADYTIQLSDTEGYCYVILESLLLNTPVIVTDLPVFEEMGIVNGENGYTLPLDMKNIPIDNIYNNIPQFVYKKREDEYYKYLTKNKSRLQEEKTVKVKILVPFKDTIAKVHYVKENQYGLSKVNLIDGWPNLPIGSIVEMEVDRAKLALKMGYVDILDEIKEVKKTRAKKSVKDIK